MTNQTDDNNKKTFLSAFNLYKGGSLSLYLRMRKGILSNQNIVLLASTTMEKRRQDNYILVRYPLGKFNSIYRLILEQILTPIMSLRNQCDHLIMMGNFACIFWFGRQSVYFHNMLYLKKNYNDSLSFKIEKFFFKWSIKLKKPKLFVQTALVENQIKQFFTDDINIEVCGIPSIIYDFHTYEKTRCFLKTPSEIVLFYPAFAYPHKNHQSLSILSEFFIKNNIIVVLTINENDAIQLGLPSLLNDKCFKLVGRKNIDEIYKIYSNCDALLFPSLDESLGMPLIEATEFKLPIIAPKLPYVDYTIRNYYEYNPFCANSLAIVLQQVIIDVGDGTATIPTSKLIKSSDEFLHQLIA
jgi:glycosyltransferase involved in cell wall biosynthesis